MFVELIIGALLLGIASAVVGSKKNAASQGFFLGFLLGPIGLIITIFIKGNRRPCPRCLEFIDPAATKCSKCGSDISPTNASTAIGVDSEMKKCPACAEMIKLEAIKCRYCGLDFDPSTVNEQIAAMKETDKGRTEEKLICPFCKKMGLYYDFKKDLLCPNCKKLVTEGKYIQK